MGHGAPLSAIADDPVGRLIRVHAASLARAARHEPCRDERPHCGPTDKGQCRIIVNDLQREIDRLRRGMDRVELRIVQEPAAGTDDDGPRPAGGDSWAVRSAGRKSYAPDALGKIPPAEGDPSPPRAAQTMTAYHHVTSIGSLLDMLA